MVQLKKEVKLFIARSLAMFNTPQETTEAVNTEFGIKATRQQCERYDPTKRAGQDLSAELKAEFEATRKDFLESPKNVPIANLAVRLQHYQRIVDGAGKNNMLKMQALEKAAMDIGGKFTNKQEHSGPGGGPIPMMPSVIELVAPDDKGSH